MQLTIQGKHIDVGDALREHVTDKLEDINQKYFNHATDASITFSKEGHGRGLIKAHIHIRVGKNIVVMADATEADPYAAFDGAAARVAKQLRRYKTRLRDHHERLDLVDATNLPARDYVLAPEPETDAEDTEADHEANPVIIAEMSMDIQTMSVSEAVMRMNLSGQSAMLFRNAKHEGLNMVYTRADGNVGWVDPEDTTSLQEAQAKSA